MSKVCEISGKKPMTGNNVSHANNKTRRRFLPNLTETSLMSETLGRTVRLKVSAAALRTVDHRGGLDDNSARFIVISYRLVHFNRGGDRHRANVVKRREAGGAGDEGDLLPQALEWLKGGGQTQRVNPRCDLLLGDFLLAARELRDGGVSFSREETASDNPDRHVEDGHPPGRFSRGSPGPEAFEPGQGEGGSTRASEKGSSREGLHGVLL